MKIEIRLPDDITNLEADYIASGLALLVNGTASNNQFRKIVRIGLDASDRINDALSALNELSLVDITINELEKLPMNQRQAD